MADSYKIIDPFLGVEVEIKRNLVDRLRGRYAIGPTLDNGEPEFGYQQHEPTPINLEAANEIERLQKIIAEMSETYL